MRVLALVRDNLRRHPGGDTTQVLQTTEALRARGVEVTLSSEARPALSGYDVVHLFHLDRVWENEAYCRRIRAAGVPAVLSTIYWPPDEFDRGGRAGLQGKLARLMGSRAYEDLRLFERRLLHARRLGLSRRAGRWWGFRKGVQRILDTVAAVLPNSHAERDEIVRVFGGCPPAVVVPNAADGEMFHVPEAPLERRGVLCVGRIEPRKNQLALIHALEGSGVDLTLVGTAGRFNAAYGKRCRTAAGESVCFVGPEDGPRLVARYQQAAVHANVSWYETPGLASLEAGLCGCRLVVTPGGSTCEYFGDEAHYCRPDDVRSIRGAIEAALAEDGAGELADRIRERYTWQAAAAQTLRGYRLAMEGT